MRGLFYRHRVWQKMNCLMAGVAALFVLFFHGVLTLLAGGADAISSGQPPLNVIIANGPVHQLISEPAFWNAQAQVFTAIFSHLGLWFHIVWFPVSIALIILVRALCTLMARPRWQASLGLLALGLICMNLLTLLTAADAPIKDLAAPPAVALYFSVAALWASVTHLRGHQAH
jgi:hypothetical protein